MISVSPELRELVDTLDNGGHDGSSADVDQALHVVNCLLLVQVQAELILKQNRTVVNFANLRRYSFAKKIKRETVIMGQSNIT